MPGLDFSSDPLLAGRIHSYQDTQLSRLGGANFHEIPINAPVVQVHNNQRDGMHRQAINRGRVSYEPNSLGGGCPFQAGAAGFTSFREPIEADKVRGKAERFAEHYLQARLFWNSQTPIEKAHIVRGFRFELSKVQTPAVRKRMVASLANVDDELAARVAEGLGIDVPEPLPLALKRPPKPELVESPALSLFARPGDGSIRTRRVAILVADGVNGTAARALHAAMLDRGAVARYVAGRLGTVKTAEGDTIEVDATFENMPSVLFDAAAVPGGKQAVTALGRLGQALEFLKDQYRHSKAILALGEGADLIQNAGIPGGVTVGEAGSRPGGGKPGQRWRCHPEVRRGDREASPPRTGDGSTTRLAIEIRTRTTGSCPPAALFSPCAASPASRRASSAGSVFSLESPR